VTAYILSSPTSDRETASLFMPAEFLAQTLAHADSMIASGDKDEIMPKALVPPIFSSPISAYRWHSLIAPGGDDDFFSSDIEDAVLKRKFAGLTVPTLIMVSEKDEMVPETVDKRALLNRWMAAAPGVVRNLCGINLGADHGVSGEGEGKWFVEKVVAFLQGV
jgi:pimeloyl-ACP methyl ester carboxylesterase